MSVLRYRENAMGAKTGEGMWSSYTGEVKRKDILIHQIFSTLMRRGKPIRVV